MKKISLILVLFLTLGLVSCGNKETKVSDPTTITIAAAASLENAFEDELIKMFQEQNENIKIKGIYDASGKLQTQIEEGLDADLFLSAASKQMNELIDKDIIKKEDTFDLLENDVVLITGVNSKIAIKDFNDITKAGKIAIGDPESVPAGIYAKEILTSMNNWNEVAKKASLGSNVTEVLNWVSSGSADVGIVYASDAKSDQKVKVVASAPKDNLESKVIYPLGIVDATKKRDAAKLFADFLKSEEAAKVFVKYGFSPIN